MKEWRNWADFLHSEANSEELRISLNVFGGCDQKWACDSNF